MPPLPVQWQKTSTNFFFASFDPGGFITVDKPPVALWFQAMSVKLFGMSSWSLLGPQAVAGIAIVLLTYALVRRTFGTLAALTAALLAALTPIAVAVDRSNVLDSYLTVALLCASWATLQAAETGKLRSLLIAAFCVGVAFNIKMLAAFILVPVLFGVWIYGIVKRQIPLKTGLLHAALAAVVLLVTSFSWMMIVDTINPANRPYIGGSTNNTVRDLVFGYNGLGRIAGGQGPGGGRGRDAGHGGARDGQPGPPPMSMGSGPMPDGQGGPMGMPPMGNGQMPPMPMNGGPIGMPPMMGGPGGMGGPMGAMFGGQPRPVAPSATRTRRTNLLFASACPCRNRSFLHAKPQHRCCASV